MKFFYIKYLFSSLSKDSKVRIKRILILVVASTLLEAFMVACLYPYLSVILGAISLQSLLNKISFNYDLSNISQSVIFLLLSVVMIGILILSYGARYVLFHNIASLNRFLTSEIANNFYEKIIYQNYESQSNKKPGEVSNLIQSLAIGMVSNVIVPIITLAQSLFLVMLAFLGISFVNFSLTVSVLILIFLIYLTLGRYTKKIIISKNKLILSNSFEIQASITEMMTGLKDIRLACAENFYMLKFNNAYKELRKNQFLLDLIVNSPKYIIECTALSIVVWITYYLATQNNLAVGLSTTAVLVVAIQRIIPSVQSMFAALSSISAAQEQLKLYCKYFRSQKTFEKNEKAFNATKEINVIDISNLNFYYKHLNYKKVFNSFNARFCKGDRIVLWGNPGSGKSTLIDIISGILIPSSGIISINGIECTHLNYKNWRSKIAVVSQRPYIYNGSIIENVVLGNLNIDPDRVWWALREVQLAEHVMSLEGKLNFRLGVAGQKLSGGQRQRLAIARALYASRRVLILDEATNSLDAESEELIIERLIRETTIDIIFIVTHSDRLRRFGTHTIDLNQEFKYKK